jgi:hypothetical protein
MTSNSVLPNVMVFYVTPEDFPFKICEYYDIIINNFCLMKRIGNALIFLIHIISLKPNTGLPFLWSAFTNLCYEKGKGL